MNKIIALIKDRDGQIVKVKVRPNTTSNDFTYQEKTYIITEKDYSMQKNYRVFCYTYGNPQPVIWETGTVSKYPPEVLTMGVHSRSLQTLLDVVSRRFDFSKFLPLINTVLIILLGVLVFFMTNKILSILEEIKNNINLILGL